MAYRQSSSTLSSTGFVPMHPSRQYYHKTFEDATDQFLFACANGDYMLVHRMLAENEVKADVTNKMGKSALQLAIENEHFEVVKVLLDKIPYEKYRDALLLAIYLGHINIADFIMNHPIYRTFSGSFLDPTHPQAYDDSQFSFDITPLILAAQYNRLLIVHQLLLKGERIKKPHSSMCRCIDCADNSVNDSFRQAQVRLSAYKGLSSEVYIALTYPDPILQAFELSHELRTLAKVEHYFREDYKKLANQLSIFVTRLLDNVRGHEELEIVLNKTGYVHEEKYENLARFDLAIQYKEKAFVAHSNCQQKLMEKWYENISVIKNAHLTKRIFFYFGFIVCLPFLILVYYFFPKSKIGSLCQQPNLKLKAYIASYLTFISLIIASSYFSVSYLQKTKHLSETNSMIHKNYLEYIYNNSQLKNDLIHISKNGNHNGLNESFVNCDISLRFTEPNPFQIAIFVWVIGFIWLETRQVIFSGVKSYISSYSNYVDCIMNVLYILHFTFLYASMIYTRTSMKALESDDYWNRIKIYDNMTSTDRDYYLSKTYHIFYWLNADRYYWNSLDSQNLAEAFFAMGNVASICRLCFLLPIIGFVGPLQVMLERMMIDISKWAVIILIFFIAFACSLFLIFSYFSVSLQQNQLLHFPPNTVHTKKTSALSDTYRTSHINSACLPRSNQSFIKLSMDNVIHDQKLSKYPNTIDTCGNDDDYDEIRQVGPYPAVYYFGETFRSTILTIFFTLFGVIAEDGFPDRGYELVSKTCIKPDSKTYAPDFDLFTSNLGFIIYGLFTFISVTVLINTLIAMMEETIDTIDDRADVEWKFARSKLYMEYIRHGTTLPVPLNIVPTPESVIYLTKRIKQMIMTKKISKENKEQYAKHADDFIFGTNIRRNDNSKNINLKPDEEFKNDDIFHRPEQRPMPEKLTYRIVIQRIVKRFLLHYKNKHRNMDSETDGFDFKEFKNDISSFRFELLNEVNSLDETRSTILELMKKLNENLNEHFDIEQIRRYLEHQ